LTERFVKGPVKREEFIELRQYIKI